MKTAPRRLAREDNVGLAGEFATAAALTNAGWFAALMPSATFPGIDLMIRKHGCRPLSVQVKSTRARSSILLGKPGQPPNVAADVFVFVRCAQPGFSPSWEFYVLTAADVRASIQTNPHWHYIPGRLAFAAEHRDAWRKIDSLAQPCA
jgi:hypothetical protein